MNDAVVTARVNAAKKEAVSKILASEGITASDVINSLYDEILRTGKVPQYAKQRTYQDIPQDELERAYELVTSLPKKRGTKFANMSKGEIALEKAKSKGWI